MHEIPQGFEMARSWPLPRLLDLLPGGTGGNDRIALPASEPAKLALSSISWGSYPSKPCSRRVPTLVRSTHFARMCADECILVGKTYSRCILLGLCSLDALPTKFRPEHK